MNDLVSEFERLLKELPVGKEQDTTELLLHLMPDHKARVLRACAIPHEFSAEIMVSMLPELKPNQAEEYFQEFAALSMVAPEQDGLSLHDEERHNLFRWWLTPDNFSEFAQISARLADYYQRMTDGVQGQTLEILSRLRMFHLLGGDQEKGFDDFEVLCRQARNQYRLSECTALIRLAHEYDSVLTPARRLSLAYHEGKLAADLRQWDKAEKMFNDILNDGMSSQELRLKSLIRLGHVNTQQQMWDEAIAYYQKALALVTDAPQGWARIHSIKENLGSAYRDKGDLAQAEKLLKESIRMAKGEGSLSEIALAYNSLGLLQLMRGEASGAIESFTQCLNHLNRSGQRFRTAQVFNNLGSAHEQLREWEKSKAYFIQSLELKREAGDTLGQALALNNLAQAEVNQGELEGAIKTTTEAMTLFDQIRDFYHLGVATRNRGKLYRRLGTTEGKEACIKDFGAAIDLFTRSKRANEADLVRKELESLTQKKGLPWWAWTVLVLLALIIIFVFIGFATS